MKIPSFSPSGAAIALLTAALFAVATVAQTPQTPPAPAAPPSPAAGAEHRMHTFPPPTNLQVLPKDLTGAQVREIMGTWADALGTHCSTCHAHNPNAPAGRNGHKRLDYALDIKPEKTTARLMYRMVGDINTNYIGMIDNSGVKVSCGTCHRGHLSPPPFVASEEHGPPMPPAGAPPAGGPPTQPPQ
ncbi:MAG: c-type cytochrome [Terracidiphilus sp.]